MDLINEEFLEYKVDTSSKLMYDIKSEKFELCEVKCEQSKSNIELTNLHSLKSENLYSETEFQDSTDSSSDFINIKNEVIYGIKSENLYTETEFLDSDFINIKNEEIELGRFKFKKEEVLHSTFDVPEFVDFDSERRFDQNTDHKIKTEIREVCEVLTEKNVDCHSEGSVERTQKLNYQDKKTFCVFCEKDVSHFSRHLQTWHLREIEVQRIFSCASSKERRAGISILAKRGNFLKNKSASQIRPVKRIRATVVSSTDDFLPCPHCLGFYSRKSLYRHTKRCCKILGLVNVKRQNSQSDGQTTLCMGRSSDHEQLLNKELFPRMRADSITMRVRNDTLICKYAYSYIKGRSSKGNLDSVRLNCRRLAKLLEYVEKQNVEIQGLMDLLHPSYFEIIINGVKKVGGYNKNFDTYESPSVVSNFEPLLKKCCDLAHIDELQKENTEDRRKEINMLKSLIDSQWSNYTRTATNLADAK